jgi:RNA polymerase sigma-70 factor (ECF subfamily)
VNTTSIGFLERLKSAKPDGSDWRRFQEMYCPLIRAWLSRVPGLYHEVDDLTQEVLKVVFEEIATFERGRDGAFRAWLRQITVNRVRAFWKAQKKVPVAGLGREGDQLLAQLADPRSDLSRQWDRDHDQWIFQKLLATVQPDFEPSTWQAFLRFALEGQPAAQVAAELGLSTSAVVQAKFRVLKRLREEAGDLLD